jgi:hypothetical protein
MTNERTVMTRGEAAKRVYPGGADRRQALATHSAKQRAILIAHNDLEGLRVLDQEVAQIETFAAARDMRGDDLLRVLNIVNEHGVLPRGQAAIEARRPRTREILREECGGDEGYRAMLTRAQRFQEDIGKAVPTLAQRAVTTGAVEDLELVRICARYAEPVTNTEQVK